MRPGLIHTVFFGISILFLISASGCKKESNKFNSIIFGKYFGECGGNCASFYHLTSNKLYGDRMEYYMGPKDLKFQKFALSSEDFKISQAISDSLPAFFTTEESQTIGCPDCRDQGGLYIEIHRNGNTKIFTIDPDVRRLPNEVMSYIDLLQTTIDKLPH